jgi:hypothetical protein
VSSVTCAQCGVGFAGKRRTARYCSQVCRQRAANARRSAGVTADAPLPMVPLTVGEGVVDTVKRELGALGKSGTSLAAQAVAIASSMESGKETGAALAALSRELRTVMALLSQGVDRGDELDELKAKRDAKRQAASGTG